MVLNRNVDLGTRINTWRRHRGLTQTALAEAVGVTVAAVSLWESAGKNKTVPTQGNLSAIVEALGITMSQFYGTLPRVKAA